MKLRNIIALFTLCVMVKGAFLAAVAPPLLLTAGIVWGAVDLLNIHLNEIKNWQPKKDETPDTKEVEKKSPTPRKKLFNEIVTPPEEEKTLDKEELQDLREIFDAEKLDETELD